MQEIKDRDVKQEEILKQWIQESSHIVFFGGAGVSTESGIPDFRSQDGLYNQEYAYPPETIISHSFFMRDPEEFYRFYKNKMIFRDAKPNAAHLALAKLEQEGKLKAVITQNIDGLHQMAGSKNVLELHGSILVCDAERLMDWKLLQMRRAFLGAAAVESLNRMWYYMKKDWISRCFRRRSMLFAMRIC